MKKIFILLIGLYFLLATSAFAVPTYFFGENLTPGGTVTGDPVTARTDFLSNLVGVGTESFEIYAQGQKLPLAIAFPGSSGDVTANLTGGPSTLTEIRTTPGFGRFATSGDNYLNVALGDGFTINFSDPISAFGFYGTDIGDFSGQLLLHVTNGDVLDIVVPHTVNAPDGALLFWGFIDTETSYRSIEFFNTSGSDSFGYDDMTIGVREQVQIPEPATMLLLGSGLIGLGFLGRKKLFKK